MNGLHLCADLLDCDADLPAMTQTEALRGLCVVAVAQAGLTAVAEHFHAFEPASPGEPAGVTGVVLLAESHLAVHTWPERGGVTLDVYVCNFGQDNSDRARALLDALLAAFAPGQQKVQELVRGFKPLD